MPRSHDYINNYELTGLIESKNGVETYKGIITDTSETILIKKVNKNTSDQNLDLFISCIEKVKGWKHPNIIPIIDYKIENRIVYLIESMFPQVNLRIRHSLGTLLDVNTIVTYVKQIANAIQYAHNQDIFHSNLKPANIFIYPSDGRLLINFDSFLISILDGQNYANSVSYLAPEQVDGLWSKTCDQYALGIMVYEWTSGVTPFKGSANEIMQQHKFVEPAALEKKASLPTKFTKAVMRALLKDPKERFENILDFSNALERAIQPSPGTPLSTYNGRHISFHTNPSSAQDKLQTKVELDDDAIQSIIWSPDSKRLLFNSGGYPLRDGWIREMDVTRGRIHFSEPITSRDVVSLIWTFQGAYIIKATGGYPNNITVYNASESNNVASLSAYAQYLPNLSCSPRMKYLAYTTTSFIDDDWTPPNTIHVIAIDTEEHIALSINEHTEDNDWITALSWSPDESYIAASCAKGLIYIWDVETGEIAFTYRAHKNHASDLAWSPDMKHIASTDEKSISIWNLSQMQKIFEFSNHDDDITALAWSPDGKMVASAAKSDISFDKYKSASILVWKFDTGEILSTHKGHNGRISALAWSPNGWYIASGSEEHYVQLRDASDKNLISNYRNPSPQFDPLVWPPNGKEISLISSGLSMVQVWIAPEVI